jgi:DNA-binding transcriptional ArsR family regulator
LFKSMGMADELTQAVFTALADPTRRSVLERLTQGPATITELAAGLPMSRQAVTKHLHLLEQARLVIVTPSGRERHYQLSLPPLQVATLWIAGVEQQWDQRLAHLKQFLAEETAVSGEDPMQAPRYATAWRAESRLLITELAGQVTLETVNAWQEELLETSERIPAGSTFTMLVDLRGYEMGEVERSVHRVMREVIPRLLAAFGFRPGYLDLFEPSQEIAVTRQQATCVAVAHVHHDADKMAGYNERLARSNERWFTDRAEAERWIHSLGIE